MKKESIVISYEPEIDKTSEMTMEEAIRQLSGYWNVDKIETMLLEGNKLFTPYAQYNIKK